MKNNKGFMATSLIYSFFLVFLMLMALILITNQSNRMLLDSMKSEIRNQIYTTDSFHQDVIKRTSTYAVGSLIKYADESWYVMKDNTTNHILTLVLARSLSKQELVLALGKDYSDTEFYKTCNDNICQTKICRDYYVGLEFCNYYSGDTNFSSNFGWSPSDTQINNQNYGKTIVSVAVNSWFQTHSGLQRVYNKNKLRQMSVADGVNTTNGYVRIPLSSEVTTAYGISAWKGSYTFHLLDVYSTNYAKVYNPGESAVKNVLPNNYAVIRPVIEVKKE